MKKEKFDKFKPYVLPVITLVFFIFLFAFSSSSRQIFSNPQNIITGFFAREPIYALNGSIELSNLDDSKLNDNCSVLFLITSETENKTINSSSLTLQQFLAKAEKKDNKYVLNIEDLNIQLVQGNYSLGVEVYCNDELVSISKQEIEI